MNITHKFFYILCVYSNNSLIHTESGVGLLMFHIFAWYQQIKNCDWKRMYINYGHIQNVNTTKNINTKKTKILPVYLGLLICTVQKCNRSIRSHSKIESGLLISSSIWYEHLQLYYHISVNMARYAHRHIKL